MKFYFLAQEAGYPELLVTGHSCWPIRTCKKSKPVPSGGKYSFHSVDEGTKASKTCDLPDPVCMTAENTRMCLHRKARIPNSVYEYHFSRINHGSTHACLPGHR